MAGQNITYIVNANGNLQQFFAQSEAEALQLEASIAGVSAELRGLASFSIAGIGLSALVEFGKSVVDTTGKLESYRNLIDFTSNSITEGMRNQAEVMKVVADYSLPIMETYSAYSKLMGAIKNTPLEGQGARDMFTDMSVTMRALGILPENMKRAQYALTEMFGEGRVQTRHFIGQFAQAFSAAGIVPEAEQLLNVTGEQLFAKLKAKNHKDKIDPYTFIPALFHQLAQEELPNLQKSLHSVTAEQTASINSWVEFKDFVGKEFKPEIIDLFHTFSEGLQWIKENKQEILNWGKALASIGEIYVKYRIALAAINIVQSAFSNFAAGYIGQTGVIVSSTEARTLAINQLAAATERLVYIQATANNMPTLAAMSAANAAAYDAGAVGVGGTAAVTTAEGATLVEIAGISAAVLGSLALLFNAGDHSRGFEPDPTATAAENKAAREEYDRIKEQNSFYHQAFGGGSGKDAATFTSAERGDKAERDKVASDAAYQQAISSQGGNATVMPGIPDSALKAYDKATKDAEDKLRRENKKIQDRAIAQEDKAKGQRVITYNVTIRQMNGQNIGTQNVNGGIGDIKQAAQEMARLLEAVTNDSELHGND